MTGCKQRSMAREPVAFTWHSITGFVRVSTNPRALQNPLNVGDAFAYVDQWLAQPAAAFVAFTLASLHDFRKLAVASSAAGNLITDAQAAALAMQHHAELCSCDSDFARFSGLQWFNPVTGHHMVNP
jgi:uncharacterized protein